MSSDLSKLVRVNELPGSGGDCLPLYFSGLLFVEVVFKSISRQVRILIFSLLNIGEH